MKKILPVFIALLSGLNDASAQLTYLVKDISDRTDPSEPDRFVKSGSRLYFAADDGVNGRELWSTDGTTAGTTMLMDIFPGTGSGMDGWPYDVTGIDFNGTLFFIAQDTSHYPQLWKTNGTVAGTEQLTNYLGFGMSMAEPMAVMNGFVYYIPTHRELWKTNGTIAGTVLVKDEIATSGVSPYKELTPVNGTLFFIGYNVATGYELWKSNGTTAGTMLVKDIYPGATGTYDGHSDVLPHFTNINGTLYFVANDSVHGSELWKSDGTTAGTMRVKDINPSGNSDPENFTYFNGFVYFSATDSANGTELWRTDGTAAGTQMFMDFFPLTIGSFPSNLTVLNNYLYFVVSVSPSGALQLWRTDGTLPGSEPVLSTYYTSLSGMSDIQVVGNDLYFGFVDSSGRRGLWKGNGGAGGFQRIMDMPTIENLMELNGNLIFSSRDFLYDEEIWISDGTAPGTRVLKDVNAVGNSYIQHLEDVNGTLFFSAQDNDHGHELWKSNGSERGTAMVLDATLNLSTFPKATTNYKHSLYYGNGSHGLTKTNGTEAGTVIIKDSIDIENMKAIDGVLYFLDYQNLWKSDGTTNGTQIIRNYVYAHDFVKVGNNLLLHQSFSGISTLDLATNNLDYLNIGGGTFGYSNNVTCVFHDTAYIASYIEVYDTIWYDSVNYYVNSYDYPALYLSDGTVAGTTLVGTDIILYSGIEIDSVLYASAYVNGTRGLFRTTSPSDSFSLVKELYSIYSENMAHANGTLFFVGDDNTIGPELWKSDGTPAGTVLVKDINPNGGSNPDHFVAKNGILYFSADDGTNGRELWQSDGTEAGTFMVADINPSGNSNPEQLTLSGDNIYFVAFDGVSGKELWAHGLSTTANCFAYYSTVYDTAQNTFFLQVDSITAAAATAYHWDFGDGTTSSLAAPSHTYSADEIYNVCLKIYSTAGDSCRYCHLIGKDAFGDIVGKLAGFNLVVISDSVSVHAEELRETPLVVFPNPSTGEVMIQSGGEGDYFILNIFNISGKVIDHTRFSGNSYRLNIADQPAGLYFIEITSAGNTSRFKLVKN